MTRPLVIYHGNCADGFSAAWVFWKKFNGDVDFHAGSYGEYPPDMRQRDVYIVDFSYKAEIMEAISWEAKTITLLDHHDTAIRELSHMMEVNGGKFKGVLSNKNSGCVLAWDYLFPNEPRPTLLGYIEDRDLWKFKLPMSREINSYVFSHDYTFEQWDDLMSADVSRVTAWSVAGGAILRKHMKDCAELVRVTCRPMAIGKHAVPTVNLPYTYVSDALAMMLKDTPSAPFIAAYWDTVDHRKFSLRSDNNRLDV